MANPWDFLRPLSEAANQFDFVIKPIVFLLALAMFVIAFLAYRRSRSKRFLFVTLAFLFFVLKWGLKLLDIFVSPGYFFADPSENVFELLIFAALFMALFKK